jgi:hypothetical protein
MGETHGCTMVLDTKEDEDWMRKDLVYSLWDSPRLAFQHCRPTSSHTCLPQTALLHGDRKSRASSSMRIGRFSAASTNFGDEF